MATTSCGRRAAHTMIKAPGPIFQSFIGRIAPSFGNDAARLARAHADHLIRHLNIRRNDPGKQATIPDTIQSRRLIDAIKTNGREK